MQAGPSSSDSDRARHRPGWMGVALRYGAGVVGAVAAALVLTLFSTVVSVKLLYVFFYPIMLAVAVFAGVGPAVLCIVLCALASVLLLPPPGRLQIDEPADAAGLAAFVVVSSLVVVLAASRRTALATARAGWATSRGQADALEAAMAARGRAESRLSEAEALTRAIVEHSLDAIVTADEQGRIVAFNPAAERMFGLTAERAIGQDAVGLLIPRWHAPECRASLGQHLSGAAGPEQGHRKEAVAVRADGSEFPVELMLTAIRRPGLPPLVTAHIEDITDRRRAQESLARERSFLRTVIDAAPSLIFVKDRGGRFVLVNEALARIYGSSVEGIVGRTDADFNDDAAEVEHFLADDLEVISTRTPKLILMERVTDARGEEHWFSTVKVPLCNEHGECDRVLGVATNVTEQRRAERALRESEERFRLIVENARDYAIFTMDLQGCVTSWNAGAENLLGYAEAEALGQSGRIFFTPEDRAAGAPETEVRQALTTDRAEDDRWHLRKDGSRFWASGLMTTVRDESGHVRGLLKILRDETEHKRATDELARYRDHLEELVKQRSRELEDSQQRLRLAERMASLGTLSAGLGHDMGNLLLPVQLRLDLMEATAVIPEVKADVRAIRTSIEYLQRLTSGLRMLALDPSDEAASSGTVDLRDWWGRAEPLMRNLLPRHVALEGRFPEGLPPVRLAEHRLMQAVFNLVQNAGDALRGRTAGLVVVWAAPAQGTPPRVRLAVTDNGPGMSAEVRARSLEPFFTTKTRGISTGMGLALVHGIVAAAGGSLEIESEPEKGTAVVLSLPAVTPEERDRPSPRAIVSLSDRRMQGLVQAVLGSLGFEAPSRTGPADQPARLWVTEPGTGVQEAARKFLAESAGRIVVLVGSARENAPGGVIATGERPGPAKIRQVLREAAERVSGTARDSGSLTHG